jgi:hypothetical protein
VLESNQAATVSFARHAVHNHRRPPLQPPISHLDERLSTRNPPSIIQTHCQIKRLSYQMHHHRSSVSHTLSPTNSTLVFKTLIMHTPPRVHLVNRPSNPLHIHNVTTPSIPIRQTSCSGWRVESSLQTLPGWLRSCC